MFQTCEACFKNFEPLLEKVMDNFNNVITTLATNDNHVVSGNQTKTGNYVFRLNECFLVCACSNCRINNNLCRFRLPEIRETREYTISYI